MARRTLALGLVAVTLLAFFPQVPAAGPACEGLVFLPHVGLACPVGGGLYELVGSSDGSGGYTHGVDVVAEPEVAAATARPPACVAASDPYRAVVIYARASDDVDRYATMVGTIRNLVNGANGYVNEAAAATGGSADIRVQCTGGVVDVLSAVLPTPKASTTFTSVFTDLRAQGHTSSTVKYWVWFDENTCSCGTGHVYADDSPGAGNLNNGNAASMFAVTFGVASTRVWTHEFSHNMGAVQNTAPHTTNGFHCTDGLDTMCYNDGAANGGAYTTTACSVEVYDCGKDDYFHRAPPPGNYLATHWNIGNPVNRFLAFGVPVADLVACDGPAVRGVAATCSFRASDDSAGVYFTVAWGDGTTGRVPASGSVPPGTVATAEHTWAATGTVTVSAAPTDTNVPANTGANVAAGLAVVEGPLLRALACPAGVPVGSPASCTFRADDDGPLRYDVDWGDGVTTRVPAAGTVAPGSMQSAEHVYTTTGTRTVRVTASDEAAHTSALTASVQALARPVMTSLGCPATRGVGASTTCSFVATDSDSTGIRYTIDWGDGVQTSLPVTGYVTPGGAARQSSHAYSTVGTYTVTVVATDNAVLPLTSAPRTDVVEIVVDGTPPAIVVRDPAPGTLYVGCVASAPVASAAPPVYATRGCVRATVSDAASGVASVQALFDGQVVGTVGAPASGATVQFEFPVAGVGLGHTVSVRAVDGSGNVATSAPLQVVTLAP